MFIAVDFDGTIVKHMFPNIGAPVPMAIEYLRKFKEKGATLILWTMRSDGTNEDEMYLRDAHGYCIDNGVEFDHLNCHPQSWTTSPKAYAHVYIDDAAFGCPLIVSEFERPYVDWLTVGPGVLNLIKEWEF